MIKDIFYGEVLIAICIIISTGLTLSVLFDEYTDKKRKLIVLVIIGIIFVLMAQNCLEFYLTQFKYAPFFRTIIAIIGYTIRPIIILLFIYIISPDKKHIPEWWAVGINTLLYFTATFSGVVFKIDDSNTFVRGPLGNFSLILSGILLAYFLFLIIQEIWETRKKESFIPVMLVIVVILAETADIKLNVKEQLLDYITIGTLIDTLFFYIWLHLKFVRTHEKNLIAEQRIQLMLSQIKPHFIYNSLSSISELCETEPMKAQQLINEFSEYLRYNFSALTEETLVSFEKQIEQVKFYLSIEKERFRERLNVKYDIKTTAFYLPNLTLQPMVENAVKHGICKLEKGGTITIKSYETENSFVVEIIDDGVGFDVNEVKKDKRVNKCNT